MSDINCIQTPIRIKVVGVGGGGCNAVNRMVRAGITNAEFIAINTDVQALLRSEAPTRIQIGMKESGGLGVGGDPQRGRVSAEESLRELQEAIAGADIVFIAAGMGGGTGTGAAPLVARLARETGSLTIAIVTRPFRFELARRQQLAYVGIDQLEDEADTMIVIPNDRLLDKAGQEVSVDDAFKMADDILMMAVRTISEVITVPGLINVDYADVQTIMGDSGPCWLSVGYGRGDNRVVDAARSAISSELVDVSLEGARGVLYIVSGGRDLTLAEVAKAADVIKAAVDKDAMCIFGVTFDESLGSDVRVTLLATNSTSYRELAAARIVEEFRPVIEALGRDESSLNLPAFERRPLSVRRLQSRNERQEVAATQVQRERREAAKGVYEIMAEKRADEQDRQAGEDDVVPTRSTRTMLDEVPLEIVLADCDDIVAYFNKDTSANQCLREIVGKKVQDCHPEESVPLVSQILQEFKTGKNDSAQLEISLGGKVIKLRLFPLYNGEGKYLGCIEITQQVVRAKKKATAQDVTADGRPMLARVS